MDTENIKLKEPPFLAKMRRSLEWVAASRQDKDSFQAGVDATLRLVTEHFRATPLLNPALVGQKRAGAAKYYYEQREDNLAGRLQEARSKRDELERILKELLPDSTNIMVDGKTLANRIASYKAEVKNLNQKLGKQPDTKPIAKQAKIQRDNAFFQLGKANDRIAELEAELSKYRSHERL